MYFSDKPVMKPEEFRLIKEFVAEKFGLKIDESKENLLSREIGHRLTKLRLATFSDYYTYLKYSSESLSECRIFISMITNNETIFFREEPQLKAFANEILPALKKKKAAINSKEVRILSAGCSSGEEVYTLAILLLESGSFFWDWDIQIVGLDVDSKVLERAENGTYSGRAIHAVPAHILERYFKKYADGYSARDMLRKITVFKQGNILEIENFYAKHSFDIIFCRNVLIYFSDDTIKRVVDAFGTILTKSGFLFLGHSESLSRITDQFVPLRFPGTTVYKNRALYE